VAVAFDAGNFRPVAEALRARRPEIRIIVCADDDWQTDGNPA
jgi:putative DNA primase/helicase